MELMNEKDIIQSVMIKIPVWHNSVVDFQKIPYQDAQTAKVVFLIKQLIMILEWIQQAILSKMSRKLEMD